MIPAGFDEKEFIYHHVSLAAEKKFIKEFYSLLEDFSNIVEMESRLEVNRQMLGHICTRVDQRKDYYMYYHSTEDKIMRMSHQKEMGLWAYWVSKYKPVRFVDKLDEERFFADNGCTVSDAFAAYIIISIVCDSNNSKAKYFTEEQTLKLYYDIANRDFSKEAIISRIEDLIA